ncbi:signal transduction histidine kinase [Streptacidiphilus sp. MAP12-16]|uniref:sensor histidine kinase n=1 Tax=Streptacidiphilus sp. MAP12-16 TaxID=3156300 RepID=UPI003513898D
MSANTVTGAAAQVGRLLAAGLQTLYVVGLAVAGTAALLAAPVLVFATVIGVDDRIGPAGGGRFHLIFGLLLAVVPCAVWGLSWATGAGGRAAGAALLAPGVLAVAATTTYGGAPPGGGHGVVWPALALLPLGVLSARWVAAETRRLVGRWTGVAIEQPYRPAPQRSANAWQKVSWRSLSWRSLRWRAGGWLTDPATWRDVAWTALTGCAVLAPAAGCAAAAAIPWLLGPPALFVLYLAALFLSPLIGLWAAPLLLTLHARGARALLGPTRQAELALRVHHLAQTRADTIDSGAAEMRRIERDLHDGAQARLVALGMVLSAAEHLIDSNPEAARAMLVEAKSSSAKALGELRDLVRGIHPPVLADRGLADAVQALALDLPLPVRFAGGLTGRPPAPVESAAYFAVSELLANVTKHAGATQVWIEIGHTGAMLRIGVTDDGHGGADPAVGSGLRGIERRLAAFDGVLAVSSPPGGPTIANLEVPCALSSPKTSSCSGTV